MDTERDESFERWNARRFYLCAALGIILSQCWPWPNLVVRLSVAVPGFIAGYYLAAGVEWLAVALHRCPRCRTRIGAPLGMLGAEVILRCVNCQTDWDLGIRQSKKEDQEDNARRDGWPDL